MQVSSLVYLLGSSEYHWSGQACKQPPPHGSTFKLKKNITKYNKYLGYKSPLVVNLIQKNQEPISTDDNVKFDYKGFVYVIIMFSLLNFWDLIMEIMREHGDVLVDNVS